MITYRDPSPNHKSFVGDLSLKNSKSFQIFWSPDYFCNYKCSYCWPGSNSPIRSHLPIEILISGLKTLRSKIANLNINHMYIAFAGGEPTLVPGFLDLMHEYSIKEIKTQTLSMSTNLTQGKNWWNKFLESTSTLDDISISASWHRESLDDIEKHRKKFIDIHDIFKSKGHQFKITIVIPPSQFDDVYADALYFRAAKIPTIIRVERKTVNGEMSNHPDYTDDMIELITDWYDGTLPAPRFVHKDGNYIDYYEDAEQVISLKKTNYLHWMCHAGYRSIVITPSGDIRRGHGCLDKKIGNIKENYELYSEPKICITKKCGCSADMSQIKFK